MIQCFLETVLIYIMLVLPNAYALCVNFHKFTQWIQQAAAYTDGATNSNIFIGKFFSCYLAGGVDGSATFIHHKNSHRPAKVNAANQLFCFFTRCAISIPDGIYIKLSN